MKIYPIILILFLSALSCKYFKPAPKLASEAATANPKEIIADSDLWLNNEYAGRISDLNKKKSLADPADWLRPSLAEMLQNISNLRERNGVFIEGTAQVAANVYLGADPLLTVGRLAELYNAIDLNAGDVYIPRPGQGDGSHTHLPPIRPNPILLAVTTQKTSSTPFAGFPIHDPNYEFRYLLSFSLPNESELKKVRILENSIEISSGDEYFVNQEQPFFNVSDINDYEVIQRPINRSAFTTELQDAMRRQGRSELYIIASEMASYEALRKIFESAGSGTVEFKVLVRK